MSKSNFIPVSDRDYLIWIDHFVSSLAAKPGNYGLQGAEIETLKTAAAEYHQKISLAADAQSAAKRATAGKRNTRKQLERITRSIARRIKALVDYTDEEGANLGIEGPEKTFDLATAKPDLAGTDQTGGIVVLTFSKHGSSGVNIYGRRDNDSGWVLLGRATVSPFVDNRPLLDPNKPELRRYTAVYMDKDQEIGQFSDEVVINCAP